MNSRTKQLNKMKREFHKLYERCIVCGKTPVDMDHIIGRNVSYKDNDGKEKNDPTSLENVFPLCRVHHSEYDRNTNAEKRKEWLNKFHLKQIITRLEFLVYNHEKNG